MTRMQRKKENWIKRIQIALFVVLLAEIMFLILFLTTGREQADADGEDPVAEESAVPAQEPIGPSIEPIDPGMERDGLAPDPENSSDEYYEPESEEIDEAEVDMLACVIYQEVGGNQYSDKCRYMVGDAVLNRVEDYRFPETIEMVLTQERQYGRFHWTGIKWPDMASNPGEAAAVQRAYDTAMALLSGEHSEIYGEGYIWQADFEQGKDIIEVDGMYFGR